MAGEEKEDELRDLVAQTLESQGVLGKIRAQLRASVFLALEEQESKTGRPLVNEKLTNFMKTKDGQLTVGLVREFLEFFELDFTCSVFDPETNALSSYTGRKSLADQMNLDHTPDSPLISELFKRVQNRPLSLEATPIPPITMATTSSLIAPLTSGDHTSLPHPHDIPLSLSTSSTLNALLLDGHRKTKNDEILKGRNNGINLGVESDEDDNPPIFTSGRNDVTTDHSLSQTSISGTDEFDYIEQIQ